MYSRSPGRVWAERRNAERGERPEGLAALILTLTSSLFGILAIAGCSLHLAFRRSASGHSQSASTSIMHICKSSAR